MHVNMKFPKVQQTVVLFILGLIWSLLLEGFKLKTKIGKFGTSYTMWMDIDPHLLLFTLLPALLAGDAMTIDTSVAKRVAWQCLYMAGPGVLVNALIVAVFLKYYFSWSFYLSLVTGSILCATDPVAVVAMLKELGASPVLTVQIQGESLLNDGTAIVLYMIAYNMLKGEQYDVADIFMFLVRTAMMAWALGMFSGYFFFHMDPVCFKQFASQQQYDSNHTYPMLCILELHLCRGRYGVEWRVSNCCFVTCSCPSYVAIHSF